ncbi:ABC transporter substrate-binding protein [Natronorubrum texcoconense]|uniref:Amino acid/amide ABC transporter substrate-binding protein, HAAT family n=1 Tax=Natronorubrum texcoconense TaxID=1095776 RepID=A0A1G9D6M5_9EURY|nr:ABC transporter substrate-binding protein [Natronorubrum texcoconense]SDK59355.1 amino acid/amide ABC transporter substrate-binding protein, HAAT family [Natronorubrum texcoconense]
MGDETYRGGRSDGTNDTTRQRTLDRRQLLKTTTAGATTISLAGCLGSYEMIGGEADDTDPVRIGVLTPNPNSNHTGQSIVRGAEVAAAELNEANGILDRDVELIVANTNASPLEARRAYHRLILEADVDVTMGVATAEVLNGLMDDIAEQETVHLTAGSVPLLPNQLVREQYETYKYHFRVGPQNAHFMGEMQLDFFEDMASEIGWESIAVLAEDYAWVERSWEIYREHLADTGVDVTLWERYPPATNDFGDIYDDVEASGADAAFVSAAHTGNELLADWATEQRAFAFGGNHVPMQLPMYYDLTDGRCEYGLSYTTATANSELTEKTQPFVEEYQRLFDGDAPVYSGYVAYDAIEVFADAAQRAETLEADPLVDALEQTSVTGTTGTIEFYDANHEFAHDVIYGEDNIRPVYFQWQENDAGDGVQEVIWPESEATANYVDPDWL